MRKNRFKLIALVFLVQLDLPCVTRPAAAQAEKAPYPAMAPVEMKTKLVLEGKSKAEIVAAAASALDKKELPALEPGAMCYMMSKQQY